MSQDRRGKNSNEESLYRIPPFFYIHVLDQNTNITNIQIGPKTYIRQDNERYDTPNLYQIMCRYLYT